MNRFGNLFSKITGIVYVMAGMFVLAMCLFFPRHNLIPGQIISGTVIASLSALIIFLFLSYAGRRFAFIYSDGFFVIISLIWAAALITTGVMWRNSPVSFYDYEVCYRSALEYAMNGTVTDDYYFYLNPHNWSCVLTLSAVMRMGIFLGFDDPYYFLLIFNVILAEAVLYSCRYLIKESLPEDRVSGPALFLVFFSFLPLYAYIQTFYTDSASFGLSVCAIAVFYFSVRQKSVIKYFLAFASGVVAGFGCLMKVTSLISIIAVAVILLFCLGFAITRKILPLIISSALGVCFICILMNAACSRSDWYGSKNIYSTTAICYVAMGLKNDGTYYENREFRVNLDSLTYKAVKEEYSRKYISENFRYFFDIDHIIAKAGANYSSGNLGAEDFARYSAGEDNPLNRTFNYDGDLYWYGCKYNMIWISHIYLVTVIGSLILLKKHSPFSFAVSASQMTFLGYFVFLFFWEANNRQLYNMMPVMFIFYVVSLKYISDFVKQKKEA